MFASFCPNKDENKKCMSHFAGLQNKVSDRFQKSCRCLNLPKIIIFISKDGLFLCLLVFNFDVDYANCGVVQME